MLIFSLLYAFLAEFVAVGRLRVARPTIKQNSTRRYYGTRPLLWGQISIIKGGVYAYHCGN